jgi:thioesterase domain-containing protein
MGPYHIAGWSAGGTVAYEVARQLGATGDEVALLAMFEASSPEYDRQAWTEWARGLDRRLRFHLSRIARLDPRQAAPYALARLRTIARNVGAGAWRRAYRASLRLGGLLNGRFQSTDQAVLFALSTYHPEPYQGRIIFFRSADGLACFGGPLEFGWGRFAVRGVEVHVVPGDHISMFEEPNVGQLAERLRQYLPRPVGA